METEINQFPYAGMRAMVFGCASCKIADALYTEEVPKWHPATWNAYIAEWIGESGLPIESVRKWVDANTWHVDGGKA